MSTIEASDITVRPGTLEDYAAIAAISKDVYDGLDYLIEEYHIWYRDPNSNFFVAEYQGEVVRSSIIH